MTVTMAVACVPALPIVAATGTSPLGVDAGIVTLICYKPAPTRPAYMTLAVAPPIVTVGIATSG
jgi:hypothetical protein